MARPLRIEFAGALYHVTARGNARADIFLDDEDRRAFVNNLGRVCERAVGWAKRSVPTRILTQAHRSYPIFPIHPPPNLRAKHLLSRSGGKTNRANRSLALPGRA